MHSRTSESGRAKITAPNSPLWYENLPELLVIVNFKQVSHIVLVFPLLTLNKQMRNGNLLLEIQSPLALLTDLDVTGAWLAVHS